jgi:hypothetical protein
MTDRRMKTFQVAGEGSRIPADKLRGAHAAEPLS